MDAWIAWYFVGCIERSIRDGVGSRPAGNENASKPIYAVVCKGSDVDVRLGEIGLEEWDGRDYGWGEEDRWDLFPWTKSVIIVKYRYL